MADRDGLVDRIRREQQRMLAGRSMETSLTGERARKVFVVHGRNDQARSAMFAFLQSIGLDPIEWSEAVKMTGEGSPYIGQVLDVAFSSAQAIVVLLTPDDIAYLRSEYASDENDTETEPSAQARPNVLFEAGMDVRPLRPGQADLTPGVRRAGSARPAMTRTSRW